MRARPVAARDEWCRLGFYRLQGSLDVLALDAGRIALRSEKDKIVVHHVETLDAKTLGEEFFFLRLGVDEPDVSSAPPRGVERLAGGLRDHLHVHAGFGLEDRQQIAEQPGI